MLVRWSGTEPKLKCYFEVVEPVVGSVDDVAILATAFAYQDANAGSWVGAFDFEALREHAEFACERLQRMALEISGTMSRFQLKLADRQCRRVGRCTASPERRRQRPWTHTAPSIRIQKADGSPARVTVRRAFVTCGCRVTISGRRASANRVGTSGPR